MQELKWGVPTLSFLGGIIVFHLLVLPSCDMKKQSMGISRMVNLVSFPGFPGGPDKAVSWPGKLSRRRG